MALPNEAGVGFQSISTPESPNDQTWKQRDLEDYISRRIKAKITHPSSLFINPGETKELTWTTVEYDTATLWNGSSRFIIPKGAEGDYTIMASYLLSPFIHDAFSHQNLYKEDSDGGLFVLDYELFTATSTSFSGTGVDTERSIKLIVDESLRPGDQVFIQISTPASSPGAAFTNDTNSYFSIRRLL